MVNLRQFEIGRGFQRLLWANVHALPAVYAPRKVYLGLALAFGGFLYRNRPRRAIPHTKLAADTFFGKEP
jgi:hypothetical protein